MTLRLPGRSLVVAGLGLFTLAPMVFSISHADPGDPMPPSGAHVKCSVKSATVCSRADDAEIKSKPNLKDIPAKPTKPATKTAPSVVQPAG
ncbi:MAG: hypothetical protein ACRDUS_20785 [Mycobacterium sp.]